MQTIQLRAPDCFFCLKKVGEIVKMESIGNGTFFCPNCKGVHQENLAAKPSWITPIGILSAASLPTLNVIYGAWAMLYRTAPIELQIGMGAFLFTGYLLKGLRLLGR